LLRDAIFWLYLANGSLLITHEIDSAYWKEWELFHLPGGLGGFLLLHIPLSAVILYGAVAVREGTLAGTILSLALAASGVFAFFIHTYFLKKGRPEFRNPVSVGILIATLVVSIALAFSAGAQLFQ
jgi:Family of unknown function (DUF6713)